MRRNKLQAQIMICICISVIAFWAKNEESPAVKAQFQKCQEVVMQHITLDEVSQVWGRLSEQFADAPSQIVSTVMKAHEESRYGQPIDEKSTSDVKQIHAVAGGMVQKSGVNEEYGMYVQIKHEGAISIYGNLSTIGVVEKERVQRGEIIGSYDSTGNKEFYYELRTDL